MIARKLVKLSAISSARVASEMWCCKTRSMWCLSVAPFQVQGLKRMPCFGKIL